MNSTEKFLRGMATYNQTMHSLIDAGLITKYETIDINWDESSPNDQRGVTMPESNEHKKEDNEAK